MSARRSFARRFDAVSDIAAFTVEVFAREKVDASLLPTIDLVLEELFTNIVKYGRGASPIEIEIAALPDGVEVVVIDHDADRFDPTRVPEVDTTLSIDQRQPGGLGLHLIRKMTDSVEYRYSESDRRSRTTVRKTHATASITDQGKNIVHD